jgi:isohexenylglutaconyl-CoA hydratase
VSAPPLLVQREGPVIHLTLNRPERRNAIGGGMGEAMDAALAALATDRAARAVVLRGAGGHFCAGLDLAELGADPGAGEARNRAIAARFQAIAALPQVVVAVVEGACHAGGLGFLCAADIALASADARFAAPEVRRGLVPAQILPWLVHRMGRSRATRLVLEGRVLDAPAALAAGLLHEVQPDRAALDAALAEILAALREGAPGALAETKGLLAALGPVVPPGYAEAGVAAFARTAAGPEAAEGIAAFREKRRPAWSA